MPYMFSKNCLEHVRDRNKSLDSLREELDLKLKEVTDWFAKECLSHNVETTSSDGLFCEMAWKSLVQSKFEAVGKVVQDNEDVASVHTNGVRPFTDGSLYGNFTDESVDLLADSKVQLRNFVASYLAICIQNKIEIYSAFGVLAAMLHSAWGNEQYHYIIENLGK